MKTKIGRSARLAAVVGLSFVALGCVPRETYDRALMQISQQREIIAQMSERQDELDRENARLKEMMDKLQAEKRKVQELLMAERRYNEQLKSLFADLEAKYGKEAVEVTARGARLGDAVLFASGEASLKAKGKEILTEIAKRIREGGYEIVIEGHTDRQPVKRVKDKFPTNWHLSSARALSVLQLLEDQGVPPENMSISAYGEYDSVVPTPPGAANARNRRVEIIVLKQGQPIGEK